MTKIKLFWDQENVIVLPHDIDTKIEMIRGCVSCHSDSINKLQHCQNKTFKRDLEYCLTFSIPCDVNRYSQDIYSEKESNKKSKG